VLREILRRENQGAQNHMISVTLQKPGFTRMMTIRLAFWLVLGPGVAPVQAGASWATSAPSTSPAG
jgi:hypothetical protein